MLDQRGGRLAADGERDDLVVLPVDHQRRDVELLQVVPESVAENAAMYS